ncbi:MAG: FAD-linked oxidase [Hyphomicrobiales bacterium]|nr:MAG: FAD-linked oxidase [Hyphomicrobiales bacterium]
MSINSWGNYPKINNNSIKFNTIDDLKNQLKNHSEIIACGNNRSYGDSALSNNIIQVKPFNKFLDFDQKAGVLHIQAGVLLADIIKYFVPRGWFLKIVPGTKFITIGGAIASDVHGKNHHIDGCFSESTLEFSLMLPDGQIKLCSPSKNQDLFRATCGGMGLTGVILDAKISLRKINSKFISQTTIKTENLEDTFAAFEKYNSEKYNFAWIDCFARGKNLGRSIMTIGDFADDGQLDYIPSQKINIPFFLPNFTINKFTAGMFNKLYYYQTKQQISHQKLDLDAYFFPLDGIDNLNRVWGKSGFLQYQCILPKETAFVGLTELIECISRTKLGSHLSVLKKHGKANENYLSFPLEGYSLALDFKMNNGLFKHLDHLDQILQKYGGRIYLTKDARVSKQVFERGYPNIEKFRELRKKYKMSQKFNSLQSHRLGL